MPLKHTVEEIVLNNGARGVIVSVPNATVVSYQINFRAGNQYAASLDKQQVAHIMEHMVFGATKSIDSAEEFSRQFTKNGGYYNAMTYQKDMVYYSEAAYMEWGRVLDLQMMAICEPKFTEEILKTEKRNVREELTGYGNNYPRKLWMRLNKSMGGLLLTDEEKIDTIDNVELQDVIDHHTHTHTTYNMRFCFVGDFANNKQEIINKLEALPLPRGEELPGVPVKYHSAAVQKISRTDASTNDVSLHIMLNRAFTIPEMIAMGRLNRILTGSFHSRILGAARKRGLSYGIHATADTSVDGATRWAIDGKVTDENAAELYKLVTQQLKEVARGNVTEQELDDVKQYAIGDYQFKCQTVGQLSDWYASDYFEDGTIDRVDDLPKYIQSVSIESIATLANEFLVNGEWALGIAGKMNDEKIDELNEHVSLMFDNRVQ